MANNRPSQRATYALKALELIELGLMDEEDFIGLSSNQSQLIVVQALRSRRNYLRTAEALIMVDAPLYPPPCNHRSLSNVPTPLRPYSQGFFGCASCAYI